MAKEWLISVGVAGDIMYCIASALISEGSAIKFTRLIPGNGCVQAEGMLKSMKTLVLIQHYFERILYEKLKLSY